MITGTQLSLSSGWVSSLLGSLASETEPGLEVEVKRAQLKCCHEIQALNFNSTKQ